MDARVEQINIAAQEGAPCLPVDRVKVTERGVQGDRYADTGDITLIEAEALEGLLEDTGIKLSGAESRRQFTTRGVSLNDLVGKRFRVGPVVVEGIELDEPCNHLQKLTKPGVLRGLVHRGGLRAAIVTPGEVAVGDPISIG